MLSVDFGEGQAFFLTAILDIDQQNNAMIFDYGLKEALNQQLLKASRIIFEADCSGIKVSFNGNGLTQILYHGEPAFTMPIPESLFWKQRREFFRVISPRAKGSYCRLALEGHDFVDLVLYDISLTGFSVLNTSFEISSLLTSEAQFERCRLVLSGTGDDVIDFKVRTKTIINPDKIAVLKIQKIGCLFTRITPAFESTIQRYINQLQRESIRKMSE